MTYGFKFLNNLNETVIDDLNVKPWFYGEAPAINVVQLDTQSFANLLSQTDVDGNAFSSFVPGSGIVSWAVYLITYQVPASYNTFIMLNLPNTANNVFYTCPNPVTFAGYNTVNVYAYVPNTVVGSAADIPKAYIFAADPIPTVQKSQGYGIQVFNQSAECVYDSGKRHLQAAQLPDILIRHLSDIYTPATPTGPTETPYGQLNLNNNYSMPSNPAWLLPAVEILWVYPEYTDGPWYMTRIPVLYKKQYGVSNLLVAQPKTYRQSCSPNDPAGLFGNAQLYASRLAGSGGNSYSALPSVVVDATVLDQGYTPPELPQSFILTKTKSGITESVGGLYGTDVIAITLTTTGVPNGTVVPYTITGISASDLTSGTLTGNFGIINNSAVAYFTATNDSLTEGTETATLSLNNGKASISFTIIDAITYSLSSYMTPEEGQSIAVTLTTNSPDGSTVPYTVTGITAADLTVGTLTGNFTVSGGTSTLEFRFAKDAINDYETMRISVNSGNTYLDIPITNVPYGNETLTISPSNFLTTETTTITITGGEPYTSFQYLITPTGTDPVYAWNNRWKSQYQSTVGTAYFDDTGTYYNNTSTGTDFGGAGSWTLWIFTDYTKNFRSANVVVSLPQEFFISGTDNTQGPLSVDEGTTGYFKVTTANVPNGTVVYPKIIGGTLSANDYTNTGASGITIQNNVATFQITFTADATTEYGSEYGTLVVQYPNGTTRNTYGVITVADTSLTPATYSLTRSVPSGTNTNEGTTAYFYLLTNQSTDLYWTLNGTGITTDDIVAAGAYDADGNYYSYGSSLSGIINSTYYQFSVQFKNDLKTEGAETLTVSIRTGSITGAVVAVASVIINDTSVYPTAGTPSGNPYCIGFNKYQNYHDGNGGIYSSLVETNSSFCGFNTYNESVTIVSDTWGDYIVELNGYMTITVGPGEPNSSFTYAITNNTDPQPTTFPGTATLDANGNFTNYLTGATAQGGQIIGDKRLWVKFAYNQHVRSGRFKVVYDAGTLSGGQKCTGTTLQQDYWDGHGGIYTQNIQTNSPTCGYVQQYYPYMSQTNYYYYNVDYAHGPFIVYGAKPSSSVKLTIVAGPTAVGNNVTVTSDIDGTATYDIGNAPYPAGTYTVNATFPNQDASYPTNYRTLVFYWVVIAGSDPNAGGGF